MLECTMMQSLWNDCYSEPFVLSRMLAVVSPLPYDTAIKRSETDKCFSYRAALVSFACSCYIQD